MNGGGGDDDDVDDSEAKAKSRAKKSKTNADGEEKKPRAPSKPVRHVPVSIAVQQSSAKTHGNMCKHSLPLHVIALSKVHQDLSSSDINSPYAC